MGLVGTFRLERYSICRVQRNRFPALGCSVARPSGRPLSPVDCAPLFDGPSELRSPFVRVVSAVVAAASELVSFSGPVSHRSCPSFADLVAR